MAKMTVLMVQTRTIVTNFDPFSFLLNFDVVALFLRSIR